MQIARRLAIVGVVVLIGIGTLAAQGERRGPPAPTDAISAILTAFRTHQVVALTDAHGNAQVQTFILSLIRDPRFRDAVDDVVLETLSARYQDVLDRYVRGEDVPRAQLKKVWEDHTVANSLGEQGAEIVEAVRAVNAAAGGGRRLRLLAGDPPIDWDNITTQADHVRWIERRDTYPADVIRRLVIDRERKALVLYGQGHLQRRQVASNYDMSSWLAQTIVSLVERDAGIHVFNLWTLVGTGAVPTDVSTWRVPSVALLKGTTIGQQDFGPYARDMGGGNRFSVEKGQIVPLPKDRWRTMPIEEQFDALLYLGPPSAMTFSPFPKAVCLDPQFVRERIRRLTLVGPPPELASFKKACGV